MYPRHRRYPRYQSNPITKDPTIQPRIETILKENLDARSKNFAESLLEFCQKNGGLTERQIVSLKKIESRFSPGEKAKLKAWTQDYAANHLANAKILASYYITTGYWNDVADSILKDPNYIPPKWKYEKMSTNKYAQKILAEVQAAPKFSVNDMIQIRSTAGNNQTDPRVLRTLRHRLCFVLDNTLPVKSAVNGGKRYKVLPMGLSRAIEVEERHMMKPNKRGQAA